MDGHEDTAGTAGTEGQVKPFIRKRRMMKLKCALTDAELLALGDQMSDANAELNDLQKEMEDFKAQHKAKVSEQEAIVSKCSALIRAKHEHRDVAVEEAKDYMTEWVTVTRLDTLEVIAAREMTESELSELPLDDKAKGDM